MWNGMFNVDDPRNQPLADAYGIVMGTSHTEPMVRATQEWTKVAKGSDAGWQWATNNATLYEFFMEGAQRAKPYENVVTVGMRGYHDTAMSSDVQTGVLEAVVNAQEEIIDKVWGDASKVPQMWCLYKEVQDYFEAGMQVPDWVTLLWTEDNFQNIRRLPVGDEKKRSGGAGVYYVSHTLYVASDGTNNVGSILTTSVTPGTTSGSTRSKCKRHMSKCLLPALEMLTDFGSST
jgi:hypothetical protein